MSMQFQPLFPESQFDIFDWYPKFQSCVRYFVDHAQHSGPVQTVAAFVNIQLPFQKPQYSLPLCSPPSAASAPPPAHAPPPTATAAAPASSPAGPSSSAGRPGTKLSVAGQTPISLLPYIRRLVVTGFDSPAVLHGFFGDDWLQGIGPIHESERRNYLFASKSDTWVRVKAHYDMADGQTVPFLKPLQNVTEDEIQRAEFNWSEWLAMQDWMLGPRAPPEVGPGGIRIKTEQD